MLEKYNFLSVKLLFLAFSIETTKQMEGEKCLQQAASKVLKNSVLHCFVTQPKLKYGSLEAKYNDSRLFHIFVIIDNSVVVITVF